MKNFFKKLSFVLAIAMVLTSIAPATASAAEVVPAKKVNVKVDGEKVDTINLTVGETETVKIGLPVKKAYAGQKSTFKTAAVAEGTAVEVVRVGNRTYELTAVEAGEATITFGAAKTKKLANAGEFKVSKEVKVVVEDGFAMTDVTAKKVNELEVTFTAPVDTDKVALSVVKGNNAVDHKVVWNAEKTVATITTTAKMTVGTYTVKATVADATVEKTVDIKNQYVAEIQILNDVALTGARNGVESAVAYVYYKVLDQYGEDLTASTSLQWSTSCGDPINKDAEMGRITLKRTDDKAFTYNEQIYVTAVHKSGLSVQNVLTVGAAQAVHSIELAGFVKKNTSEIVDVLPVGFRSGEYYLVYDAVDQNGNVLDADAYNADEAYLRFLSDNVMLVKEIVFDDALTTIVVDGHEYRAAVVNPGDFVDKGGEVNISAIANKTGNTTVMNYVVGENRILASFAMTAPAGVFADGESAAIPFTALDTNGEEITNFVTLADNLNKLTFSVSEGTLKLSAKNDGTAKLTFEDSTELAKGWNSGSTDGVDRPITITAVVIGGESETLSFSISDKARPEAIYEISDFATTLVEGGSTTAYDFGYLDQYGRKMLTPSYAHTDNGFFAATATGALSGNDFFGYAFTVAAEYKGTNALTMNPVDDKTFAFAAATNGAVTVSTGNNAEFRIIKTKLSTLEVENVSPVYKVPMTVVDIKQVKNVFIKDLGKQYVNTNGSAFATGALAGVTAGNAHQTLEAASWSASVVDGYNQGITVLGYYNNTMVTIPVAYYTVTGNKLIVDRLPNAWGGQDDKITNVSAGAIRLSDLYDVTTAQFIRKDTTDTLTAIVKDVYNDNKTLNVASKQVVIADAAPVLTAINVPETMTISPANTGANFNDWVTNTSNWYSLDVDQWWGHNCIYKDQYGVNMHDSTTRYIVSNVVEADGYVAGNFTVNNNNDTNTSISGAECGDTFTLTLVVTDRNGVTMTKDIKVTVGADSQAKIQNTVNYYTNGNTVADDLKDTLEGQRQLTLN